MSDESILAQSHVEPTLATARHNLERYGELWPVLFLRFADGRKTAGLLKLPAASEDRRAYFATIGASLRKAGNEIREALFVSEGWYVEAAKGTDPLAMPPSKHPQRQEAIVIMGRDADGARVSSVVQPFGRDRQNKPVWREPTVAFYNEAPEKTFRPVGLIDELFTGSTVKTAPREQYSIWD